MVIGAGVAGLATAALLGREGHDVIVVERTDVVGGRAGIHEVAGFRFDTGPSWYLMPDAFEQFYRLLGTSSEEQLDLVPLDPAYRLFPEGEAPLDVPSGEAVFALAESLEAGAGERLRRHLASAGETYDISVDRFLYTTFPDPRAFLRPSTLARSGKLTGLITQSLAGYVNKRFADHRLRQMLTYPAVFLSSHPERTPALYHLMSHTDLVQGVRFPLGGFAAVVASLERLAREQGAEIRLRTEVTAIESVGGRATGVRLADGSLIDAPLVVSAADLHHTETRLLPPELRTYPEKYFARREPGLGTVLVLAGVRGELPELTHHNLFFSRDWTPDFDAVFDTPESGAASRSIYVSKTSATEGDVAPAGHENLFLLVPVAADPDLGHGSLYRGTGSARVEAIADAALAQLGEWADIPDLTERLVVRETLGPADFAERFHAWSGGSIGPAHTLWQSAFLRGRNASRKVRGLYYAGATTVPGVGVPMCLISAENVIKRLRGDRSSGALEG
ncbi:phytoene desaturase [Corynebacterium nasicanis]